MRFFIKIWLVIISASFLFAPLAVVRATDISPEFNPLCWTREDCINAREEAVGVGANSNVSEGWLENVAPCEKQGWGKCLPAGVTVAAVSFGGNKNFSDIGQYIKTVYNYSLVIIGILATVIIIIAGAQWITSAGNTETISGAKKKITGAVIGLIIAYMSYNILNSINPATINLRLPQVYMIREQILASKWCKDLAPETFFAFAADGQHQSDKVEATGKEPLNLKYPFNKTPAQDKTFWCGQRFFVSQAAADVTCIADRCDSGWVCTNYEPIDKNNPYMCRKGSIAGEVTGFFQENTLMEGLGFTDSWEHIESNISIYLACNDGDGGKTINLSVDSNTSFADQSESKMGFVVNVDPKNLNSAVESCGGTSKVLGAFLEMKFDLNASPLSENHYIGNGGVDIWAPGAALGCEEAPVVHPKWYNPTLFIPYPALQTGVQINIDSTKIPAITRLGSTCKDYVKNYKKNFMSGYPPAE